MLLGEGGGGIHFFLPFWADLVQWWMQGSWGWGGGSTPSISEEGVPALGVGKKPTIKLKVRKVYVEHENSVP